MRVTFIYIFNLGGNHFEGTTDHTKIPQMCLIEADGDGNDVDIDICTDFLKMFILVKICMFINGIFHCCTRPPLI